jgi:hypothetical protein
MEIKDLEFKLLQDNVISFYIPENENVQIIYEKLKQDLTIFYQLQDQILPPRKNKTIDDNHPVLEDKMIFLYLNAKDNKNIVNYGSIGIVNIKEKKSDYKKDGFDKYEYKPIFKPSTKEVHTIALFFFPSKSLRNNLGNAEAEEKLNEDRNRFVQYLKDINLSNQFYFKAYLPKKIQLNID